MVAVAVVGSAVIGAAASNQASRRARNSARDAARRQEQVAQDARSLEERALEWNISEANRTRPMRDQAYRDTRAVTQAQLGLMNQQMRLSDEYANYNRTTFRPLEQRMVREAQAYDTPERRNAAASEAVGDVNAQIAAQRQAATLSAARRGVAPDSASFGANMDSGSISAARMAGSAAYGARRGVEQQGYARMADAANLGRGLPSAQATAASTGVNAGTAAVNSGSAGLNQQMSGAGLMNQGFGLALQANQQAGAMYGNAAGIYNQIAGQQADAINNGARLGMSAYGAYVSSDESKKKNTKKKANTRKMLDQVKAIPNKEGWKYDPAKGGIDDGGIPHDGPMAGDVQRVMGDDVAPNGEVIDVVSMQGRMLGAVQELAKRVDKLENSLTEG